MSAVPPAYPASLRGLGVGLGYDVHRLVEGRPLILGGIRIDHPLGLAGHSDADVVSHAAADALLGAARLGDIGEHFPDHDPRYENADSLELLRQVAALLNEAGVIILDIDLVVVAQAPKLSPYRDLMRAKLAGALSVSVDSVGLKATTTEQLGFEGREEGISAQAVALVGRCC